MTIPVPSPSGRCHPEQIVSGSSWKCGDGWKWEWCRNRGWLRSAVGEMWEEKEQCKWCSVFDVSNILVLDDGDHLQDSKGEGKAANYWLAEEGLKGEKMYFIMNLGCSKRVSGVSLKNTHNANHRDRSTKKFRILGSGSEKGPWQELLVANLEDSRQQNPPPLQHLKFASSAVVTFIEFQLLDFYGLGGGLQYFAVTGDFLQILAILAFFWQI